MKIGINVDSKIADATNMQPTNPCPINLESIRDGNSQEK